MSLYDRFSRRPEWESAIGRLMMASASLEMKVLMAIAHYGGSDSAKHRLASGHTARLTALQDIASNRDEDTKRSVNGIIAQLREFNRQRNHVAHSPLIYALDEQSEDSHRYGAVTDLKNPERRIGLDEIVALAERGEELAKRFSFTFMMVMGNPD